jgi:flavorubredoxin
MTQIKKLSENVYWLGINDRKTHLFENLWPIDKGVSYNSYIICDEKVALIDTVETGAISKFMEKLDGVLNGRTIDYLVINHLEPDHSAGIPAVIERFPNIKLIGNNNTAKFLSGYFNINHNFQLVKDLEEIDLGQTKLKFYMTPMIHWPETMMTYTTSEEILFSGDAFGTFGALDGGLFDDELNFDDYENEMRRYYSNIVGKYGKHVQKAIQKLSGTSVKMIASTHGPVWRKDISKVISLYDKWSKYETEDGVVIVYGSMYGNTEKMADSIAFALKDEGIHNIKVYNASKTHLSYILSDIFKYKGLIIGTPTYNAGVYPPIEALISTIEHSEIKNHLLGIFGSCTWVGGGVKKLIEWSEKIGWEMVADPFENISVSENKSIVQCNTIAKNMAAKLMNK